MFVFGTTCYHWAEDKFGYLFLYIFKAPDFMPFDLRFY